MESNIADKNNAKNDYNGVLCVKKPSGFTSFDVIAKLRGVIKFKKIGHGGTLDPMATGVLPLFLGKATKAIDYVCCHDKEYTAKIKFGIKTDTLDVTGKIISKTSPEFSKDDLLNALEKFKGNIMQIPPMFSAVKVDGKRLYSLARNGKEVQREPRPVTVYKLDLLSFDIQKYEADVFISCSKGTYIRQIAEDLGDVLKCGAMLSALERNSALGFNLSDCLSIEQIEDIMKSSEEKSNNTKELNNYIIPTQQLFQNFSEINLNSVQSRMFCNGVKLDINRIKIFNSQNQTKYYKVFGEKDNKANQFLGLVSIKKETDELILEKQF